VDFSRPFEEYIKCLVEGPGTANELVTKVSEMVEKATGLAGTAADDAKGAGLDLMASAKAAGAVAKNSKKTGCCFTKSEKVARFG